jgi:hypothetical protein
VQGSGVAGAGPVGTDALEQLRSGAIDLGRYLDIKVADATAHLSFLPSAELATIQAALRERLASDPGLVGLVQLAGQASGESSSSSNR